jgi:NADH-quinone oxidoreductase subunit L
MSYLSLFTLFMLILVTANNFVQMFVGWEGVGLSSYLLINFWFTRIQANKSAIKAMLINRIGDFFLLLAIFVLYFIFNTLSYDIIFSLSPLLVGFDLYLVGLKFPVLDLICFFIFFGAVGKSAQLGLHTWLPDAMEGPTPVSALIHAATMVTAGVYLIARSSTLFIVSPFANSVLLYIGLLTSILAGFIAIAQKDIKKILAFSTVSQLGLMVVALGLGAYTVALFHLVTHAFFKALLFLGAGSVIHGLHNIQDISEMGGLAKKMPITFWTMLIGCFSLAGFPPLSGFMSKDHILLQGLSYSFPVFLCLILISVLTSVYSMRLLGTVFGGSYRGKAVPHESGITFFIPLIILAIASIFGGFLPIQSYLGHEAHHSLFTSVLLGVFSICTVLFCFFLFWRKSVFQDSFLSSLFYRQFYINQIYHRLFVSPILIFSIFSYRFIEKGLDFILLGCASIILSIANGIAYIQRGKLSVALSLLVLGVSFILIWVILQ